MNQDYCVHCEDPISYYGPVVDRPMCLPCELREDTYPTDQELVLWRIEAEVDEAGGARMWWYDLLLEIRETLDCMMPGLDNQSDADELLEMDADAYYMQACLADHDAPKAW